MWADLNMEPLPRFKSLSIVVLLLFFLHSLVAVAQTKSGGNEDLGESGNLSEYERRIVSNSTITLNSTTTYVFRLAADYNCYAAVIRGSDASNFVNGGTYTYYGTPFDGNFGTKSITLGPGTYAVALRNKVNSDNEYKVELDRMVSFSNAGGPSTILNKASHVDSNGGKYWHGFSIASGYYYYMDGANSGVNTYIIPSNQLGNFQTNGVTFQHYSDYDGQRDKSMPGGYQIKLSPGSYYLCFHNEDPIRKAVVYTLQRFRANTGGGGTGGGNSNGRTIYPKFSGGGAAWRTLRRQTRLRMTIPKIVNRSSSRTTGTLKVAAIAHRSKSRVSRGGGQIIGEYRFTSRLRPNTQFGKRNRTVRMKRPPRGRVYTAFVLREYSGGRYRSRDVVTFRGTSRFRR